MARTIFSPSGIFQLGKNKGTHASALPPSFVFWAKENIAGFTASYEYHLKPKPERTGRRYILDYNKKFIP